VFLEWGWRVPFLLSGVLIAVGLWVRLRTTETPVFAAAARTQGRSAIPFADVWRRQPRTVLLTVGVMTGIFACISIGSVYLTNYATSAGGLGLSEPTALVMNVVAGLATGLTTVLSARWSDRFGRRRIILGASVALVGWSLVMFPLMGSGSLAAFGTGLVVLMALIGLAYGPVAAYLPEAFPTAYRYTGTGLTYNLGGVAGGGVALVVAPLLAGSGAGTLAIGIYLAVMMLLTVGCLLALPETKDASLTDPGSAVA
jgi:MFS family permease